MFTLFGVLLILTAIGLIIGKYFNPKINGESVNLPKFSTPILIGGILLGLLFTAVFYAKPGHSYKVYYPFGGGSKIVTSTGFNFDWWGTKRCFQNEIAFKYVIPTDTLGSLPKLPDNIYSYSAMDHQWEFADAVKANIGVSIVLSINPFDTENFSKMVDDVKTEEQLVYGRIIPDINTAIKNTCKLMYAQEYISGEAANYDRYLNDQLENGSYQLEPYYEYGEESIIGDTSLVNVVSNDGSNKKGNKRYKILINSSTKLPLRDEKKTSLTLYHISVRQAVSDNIQWEPRFNDRLDKQKAQVAETQLEKQMAEKAIYNQKRLYAEGEAKKTEEKARLEKEQIQKTITAQTAAQVAAFTVQEEANLLEASYKSSERVRVQADAQGYANARLVQGGLTPQQKAEYENARVIGVAAELSKLVLPQVYITGNEKSQDGLLTNLISADLAKQMLTTPKKE